MQKSQKMALQARDVQQLGSWNFLSDYQKRRNELLTLARAAYLSSHYLKTSKPTPDDCEGLYKVLLEGAQVFLGMIARKPHLPPQFYDSMCLALAKYVLHTDWVIVSRSRRP